MTELLALIPSPSIQLKVSGVESQTPKEKKK
jgi:hypothetical protein